MNIKKVYSILALLLGYGLIIGGFVIFGAALDDKVRVLDIIAACLIFTQFVLFSVFPLVNLNDSSHKEVGMLGIHISSVNLCCILSLAIIVFGILLDIPFIFQLFGQLGVLFFLLLGRIATLRAGEKVAQIHTKETRTLAGKKTLRMAMDDFMDSLATEKNIDEADKKRLEAIHESLRYLSPSANPEAMTYDEKFLQTLGDLTVMMRDSYHNKARITEEIGVLERTLLRRKQY